MEPTDLTIRILQDIREEIRGLRTDQETFHREQSEFNREQAEFNRQQAEFNRQAISRFEVIETTLRDLAQQLVILGRGVKMLIEGKSGASERLDDHEQRILALEKRQPA